MTTISHAAPVTTAPPTQRRKMSRTRRVALVGGLMYLLTFAASFPQLKLFSRVINDPEGFVSGHGSKTPVLWGSWLEVITALSGIGTAVALYPITRRVSTVARRSASCPHASPRRH